MTMAALLLVGCSQAESADVLIAQDGDHPVCKSAQSTLEHHHEWMTDAAAMRDRGIWDQKKFLMVIERAGEYAPKMDPEVRDYSGYCDDLDRIRSHYAF